MVIHIVSATSVYADETRDPNRTSQLAMCGERLGPYAEASKTHPVGNYLSVTSPVFATVTCDVCRGRVTERRNQR